VSVSNTDIGDPTYPATFSMDEVSKFRKLIRPIDLDILNFFPWIQ